MSATGISSYWPMFEPRVPGFVHIPSPYPYRYQAPAGVSQGVAAANELEKAILAEGPDTVAMFLAEPVQGAGGVIAAAGRLLSAHPGNLHPIRGAAGIRRGHHRLRSNRHEVRPRALGSRAGHDLSSRKALRPATSRSAASASPTRSRRPSTRPTRSGCTPTPTALIRWGAAWPSRTWTSSSARGSSSEAKRKGKKLLDGLRQSTRPPIPHVGDVRGLGMMCAVEIVKDKATKEELPGRGQDRIPGARGDAEARTLLAAPGGRFLIGTASRHLGCRDRSGGPDHGGIRSKPCSDVERPRARSDVLALGEGHRRTNMNPHRHAQVDLNREGNRLSSLMSESEEVPRFLRDRGGRAPTEETDTSRKRSSPRAGNRNRYERRALPRALLAAFSVRRPSTPFVSRRSASTRATTSFMTRSRAPSPRASRPSRASTRSGPRSSPRTAAHFITSTFPIARKAGSSRARPRSAAVRRSSSCTRRRRRTFSPGPFPKRRERFALPDFRAKLGLLKNCRDAEDHVYGAQESFQLPIAIRLRLCALPSLARAPSFRSSRRPWSWGGSVFVLLAVLVLGAALLSTIAVALAPVSKEEFLRAAGRSRGPKRRECDWGDFSTR